MNQRALKYRITLKQEIVNRQNRGRRQEFYWVNNIKFGLELELTISLIACLDRREEINKLSGEVEVKYSEHTWISNIPFSINNAHEICNLGARKKNPSRIALILKKTEAIIISMHIHIIGMLCRVFIY